MTTTLEPRLREEDFVPGQRWVHPDTKLEYEDFHAFFCGKDPLPHWRNARIKEANAFAKGNFDQPYPTRTSYWSTVRGFVESTLKHYDRDGDLFAGPKYLDFDSRTSSVTRW